MIHSIILSFLLLFSGTAHKKIVEKTTPTIKATFCGIPEGPIKISSFSDCSKVTLSGADGDCRIIEYSLITSPKQSVKPPYIEKIKGEVISQPALDRIKKLAVGDLVILADVKIQTKAGIEKAGGSLYKIVAE
jgi:hypothetical protein